MGEPIRNSNEDELKRKRTAIMGKIKRRTATIERLELEKWRLERELGWVERELIDYAPRRSQP